MIDLIPFQMSDADRHSALWLRFRAECERRLAEKRAQNDGIQHDQIKTAFYRGQIDCLKQIIRLGELPPRDG